MHNKNHEVAVLLNGIGTNAEMIAEGRDMVTGDELRPEDTKRIAQQIQQSVDDVFARLETT